MDDRETIQRVERVVRSYACMDACTTPEFSYKSIIKKYSKKLCTKTINLLITISSFIKVIISLLFNLIISSYESVKSLSKKSQEYSTVTNNDDTNQSEQQEQVEYDPNDNQTSNSFSICTNITQGNTEKCDKNSKEIIKGYLLDYLISSRVIDDDDDDDREDNLDKHERNLKDLKDLMDIISPFIMESRNKVIELKEQIIPTLPSLPPPPPPPAPITQAVTVLPISETRILIECPKIFINQLFDIEVNVFHRNTYITNFEFELRNPPPPPQTSPSPLSESNSINRLSDFKIKSIKQTESKVNLKVYKIGIRNEFDIPPNTCLPKAIVLGLNIKYNDDKGEQIESFRLLTLNLKLGVP